VISLGMARVAKEAAWRLILPEIRNIVRGSWKIS